MAAAGQSVDARSLAATGLLLGALVDGGFLPASRQRLPGAAHRRRGVRTRSLVELRRVLAEARLPIADCRLPIADCRLPIASMTQSGHSRSLFFAPAQAHGLWLEFREPR